jgi:hypothetical protein
MRIWLFSEYFYLIRDFYKRLNNLGFECEILSNTCFKKWILSKIDEEKGIIIFICNNFECCHLEEVSHIPVLIINSSFESPVLIRGILRRNCSDEELRMAVKETQALWK